MRYEVVVTERACQQLDSGCEWYAAQSPELAAEWYNGFIDALLGLEHNPERFGFAHESQRVGLPIRELLDGIGRRKTHRGLFAVRPDRVVIYAIRHVAQQDVTADDL
jgi:plasmid stabilization system protein ParE